MYELTLDMARMAEPPPEQAALFAAIAADQDTSDRFPGMSAVPSRSPSSCPPEHLARLSSAVPLSAETPVRPRPG